MSKTLINMAVGVTIGVLAANFISTKLLK